MVVGHNNMENYLIQQLHHLIVRQLFRLLNDALDHAAARTQAMRSLVPGQPLDLALKHFVLLLVIANAIRSDLNRFVQLI